MFKKITEILNRIFQGMPSNDPKIEVEDFQICR